MKIFQVAELTDQIHDVLETEFPFIWVKGEVQNYTQSQKGHCYFSLVDGKSSLPVVWFQQNQWVSANKTDEKEKIHPLTGEVIADTAPQVENGQTVLCSGRISVYKVRGSYQLLAELVQTEGMGELQALFEELKRKLQRLGYFERERKKDLPKNPQTLAIISSPQGAVIHDFLRIAQSRGLFCKILFFPVLVQGTDAKKQIVAALKNTEKYPEIDCVALIRGGGSPEDLWTFNTEAVATAIFNCPFPVITGIGHEPDVSIADYVADYRAATPTHAAQVLFSEKEELAKTLSIKKESLQKSIMNIFAKKKYSLQKESEMLANLNPKKNIEHLFRLVPQWKKQLDLLLKTKIILAKNALIQCDTKLRAQKFEIVGQKQQELALYATKLAGLNPKKPLEKGYAYIKRENGQILKSINDVEKDEILLLHLLDGTVTTQTIKKEKNK